MVLNFVCKELSTIIIMNKVIIHINPLMFDVVDDKPEGVAIGVYNV